MRTFAKTRTTRVAALALAVGTLAIAAWAFGSAGHESTATAAPALPVPSAASKMSALKNPGLIRSDVPAIAQRMGADIAPNAATVSTLVTDFSSAHLTVYAWQRGSSGSVCYVAPAGGGGCFAQFRDPFDISFTDADGPGRGDPMLVWGPVSDDVTRIEITVGSTVYQAAIKNNIAVFQLPSGNMSDADVKAVTATLRNGDRIPIRI